MKNITLPPPGLPKLDFNTQCKMLYSNDFSPLHKLIPELNRANFSPQLIESYITVSKSYYKQYLKNAGLIKHELNKNNNISDGVFLLRKGTMYEMISRERGISSTLRTFSNEDELLEMLANKYRGFMCKY